MGAAMSRWVYRTDPDTGEPYSIEVGRDWTRTGLGGHASEAEVYRGLSAQEMVEVEGAREVKLKGGATIKIGGRQELVTIPLDSKRARREYMETRGLADRSDFNDHLVQKSKERADLYSAQENPNSRHQRDIHDAAARAVHQHFEGRRKKSR